MNFSVLISNFNYRSFVGEAIQSVLAQSLAPSEIIVVDDGSTDGSLEYLRQSFGGIPKVKIVATANRGQIASMVEGFRHCTGDVISFLDADDNWNSGYLERVAQAFAVKSVDFVMVNVQFYGGSTDVWNTSRSDADFGVTSCLVALADQPPWHGTPTSGLSIRRALAERIFPPESFWSEWKTSADDCLVLGGAILGAHKYYIGDTLVNYRIHGANAWAVRTWNVVGAAKYEIRRARMLHYYRNRAYGSQSPVSSVLHFEFKSLPRPTLGHLIKYVGMAHKTRGSMISKARVIAMMVKYWFKESLGRRIPQ
jgi:glycosyltransferase involved in cell wall biosynthesis